MRRVTFLIEDELFKKAKIKAIEADMNMTEYITMLIKSDLLSKETKKRTNTCRPKLECLFLNAK